MPDPDPFANPPILARRHVGWYADLRDYKRFTRPYHIGLRKDRKHPDTMIIELREEKACLDCELWKYLGQWRCSKAAIRRARATWLKWINEACREANPLAWPFTKIRID